METNAYVINAKQSALVTTIATEVIDILWRKGGLIELQDRVSEVRGGIASRLMNLYREAESVGKGDSQVAVSAFQSLTKAYDAALILADQKAGGLETKRKLVEIDASWPPMKSEMLRALRAGVKATADDGKPKGYSTVKAERAKVDPNGAGSRKEPQSTQTATVTGKLAAVLKQVTDLAVTLDATGQDDLADWLMGALAKRGEYINRVTQQAAKDRARRRTAEPAKKKGRKAA